MKTRSMRVFGMIMLIIAASVASAGCGGGASKMYSADATRACLEDKGATVDPDGWDYISDSGHNGSYGVKVGANTVVVGFFRMENDAKGALAAYKLLGEAQDVPMSDVLARHGNVTLSWDSTPTSQESGVVEGCLS